LQLPIGVRLPIKQLVGFPHSVLVVGNSQAGDTPLHDPTHGPEPAQRLRAGLPPVRGSPRT
jgi:hypothetical protein